MIPQLTGVSMACSESHGCAATPPNVDLSRAKEMAVVSMAVAKA